MLNSTEPKRRRFSAGFKCRPQVKDTSPTSACSKPHLHIDLPCRKNKILKPYGKGLTFSYYLTVKLPWHVVPILRTEGEEVTECLATISRPPDLQPEISKDSQFKDLQPVPCFPIVSAVSSAKESILCAAQCNALNCSYRGAPQELCLPGRGA